MSDNAEYQKKLAIENIKTSHSRDEKEEAELNNAIYRADPRNQTK